MKQSIAKHILLLTTVTTFGCAKQQGIIEGKWEIDLEPMVEQAKSMGASTAEIQGIKDMFSDGKLTIDSNQIKLAIAGEQSHVAMEYHVVSNDGACVVLAFKSTNDENKYCVRGSRLEVHDPSTKLVVVYRRT